MDKDYWFDDALNDDAPWTNADEDALEEHEASRRVRLAEAEEEKDDSAT